MSRLPPHHVRRPRLTQLCADQQVVVVEAAGGYGKSVLGAELVDHWGTVGIDVSLDHGGVTAPLLAARLHTAVQRAGFTDAATAAPATDPVGMVDGLLDALAGESCAVVIDDAHNAAADAAALLEHLAGRVAGRQRLVVLARQLPQGALRLRRANFLQLSAADLAMEAEETIRVCRDGFGLPVDAEAAEALGLATGGWTAATVLAAARAARTGETLSDVAAVSGSDHSSRAVAAILDEALSVLGPARRGVLAQLARLPLLDQVLVDTIAAEEGFFGLALGAGIPLTPSRGSWWELPGPVRDHLATLARLREDDMKAAASEYRRRGELGAAMDLLLASGDADTAAAMLAQTSPDVEETLDTFELRARYEQLPPRVVDDHPELLVLVARRLGYASVWSVSSAAAQRAKEIADRREDPALKRSAEAESIKVVLLANREYATAADQARRILREAGPREELTRARASEALGYALCHIVGADGSRDDAGLTEAEDSFTRAAALYRALGMRSAASFIGVDWSVHIEFRRGQLDAAMRRIEEAILLAGDRPRAVGFLMIWRALFAAETGQGDLCRRSVGEVFRSAERVNSGMLTAQGHWKLAVLSSYEGDAEAAVAHVRQVEAHRGTWWTLVGAEFLAEAADLCDRVGLVDLASDFLARAKADPQDAEHVIALAEAAIAARHGDPLEAQALLERLAGRGVDQRERWRVTLFLAYVAYRQRDLDRAAALAASAFEEAARIGQPHAPLIRERSITDTLLRAAVRDRQAAPLALEVAPPPMSLATLGLFELSVAGRAVRLRPGQEGILLKYLVARGGRAHSEEVMEALWPTADPDAARNRLRTVLSRVRASAGSVVEREGSSLVLSHSLTVDMNEFLAEVDQVRAAAATNRALAVAIARNAMARYRGDFLPDDLYEDWADEPRQRVRMMMVELLDLCASDASQRGDLDELRRIVEQSIEFNPYDDDRYLQLATTLAQEGRRGEALSVLRRARAALAEIGLAPPQALVDLETSIMPRPLLRGA